MYCNVIITVVLANTSSWTDPKGSMLGEGSQTKINIAWYLFCVDSEKAGLPETESRMIVTRAWGMGEMGSCFFI